MSFQKDDLEILYNDFEKSLYNLALRWVWDTEVASEIVQESYLKLWDSRRRIHIETAKAYLFKICLNKCKNKLRQQKITQLFNELLNSLDFSEDDYIEKQNTKILKEKIEILPAKLKEVLVLTEISELSYTETALILNIPEGTVGSRKNEALKILRSQVDLQQKEWI